MNDVVRSLATFCCAVFFGAALYISLVQHPAAHEAGNAIYLGYFPAMYRRAAVLQGGTAVLGFLAASWPGVPAAVDSGSPRRYSLAAWSR
jgi:hypothetical protein